MLDSLWGDEFKIDSKDKTTKTLKKIASPKTLTVVPIEKQIKSKKLSLDDRLSIITSNVTRILGQYKSKTTIIDTLDDFKEYISQAIKNGVIAIDTETNNSLDPITCKLMGSCIYTPSLNQAYIPHNHVDRNGVRLNWQLTEEDVKEQFQRLIDNNVKIIMHNGKFDYQVIKCTCGICLPIYWDTLIGAKLLDENEPDAGLKYQYISKINHEQEKYSIDHLFENVEYAQVDPRIFALYAATDSMMTYELYKWQLQKFNLEENKKLLKLMLNIETPLVIPIAEMELAGFEVDTDYAVRLSKKFNDKLKIIDNEIDEELKKLSCKIQSWRDSDEAKKPQKKLSGEDGGKSKNEQLSDPINLSSPTQLAILFYDVLKCPIVNKKKPRGTGEEEIKSIYDITKLDICDLLLKRRELVKLISTYVDVIPELSKKWVDGRVRTHFNQYGAATGRLSSSKPLNFQNIPSHEKTIRMMFRAKHGYRIIGADFSAQEPRLTAFMSQDPSMIKAYADKKDLYSVIAAMSFNRKYEDCLEFYPTGTRVIVDGKEVIAGNKDIQNKEGKYYRTMAKSILLGLLYGRGAMSVGEQIGKSKEDAQIIIDKFFNAFPTVKKWINESIESAHILGYVEDVVGRRRRLPDAKLPKYEISVLDSMSDKIFNPFIICEDRKVDNSNAISLINKYKKKLDVVKYNKDFEKIKEDALKEGVTIKNNNGYIAQAERQSVNAIIQGGAATLTKCALIKIFNDERLKIINAKLINTVHDEILIEAPEEYSKEAEEYLMEDMLSSAKEYVPNVDMAVDCYNVSHWYEDEMNVLLKSEYKKNIDNGMNESSAEQKVIENHIELTEQQVLNGIHTNNIF